MELDKRIEYPVKFKTIIENMEPEMDKIIVDNLKNMEFIDFIQKKTIYETEDIISDKIKEVFEMYQGDIQYRPIHLVDSNREIDKMYWKFEIKEYKDIITDHFIKVVEMPINSQWFHNQHIVKLLYHNNSYILISLPVLESILRRLPLGITLRKLKEEKQAD